MTVEWNGDEIIAKVRAAAMTGVVRGTESVVEEATSLILETAKTGRVYRRRGVTHQASAPGEPFASDTGRTLQSQRTEYDQAELSGTAIWGGAAELLEHGTAKMAPRSFARPALANKHDEIQQDIAAEVRNALK